jgi:hypothetical protein
MQTPVRQAGGGEGLGEASESEQLDPAKVPSRPVTLVVVITRRIAVVVGAGLLGAAIVEELLKPVDQRTWEGRLFDLVPYDLRLVTPEGFRAALERPEEARIVLGYRVDLARLAGLARKALR